MVQISNQTSSYRTHLFDSI